MRICKKKRSNEDGVRKGTAMSLGLWIPLFLLTILVLYFIYIAHFTVTMMKVPSTKEDFVIQSQFTNACILDKDLDVSIQDNYTILKDFLPSRTLAPYDHSITFVTHASIDSLLKIQDICRRWNGPISLAVFTPGEDILTTVFVVGYLKKCTNSCIQRHLSMHLVLHPRYQQALEYLRVLRSSLYCDTLDVNCPGRTSSLEDLMAKRSFHSKQNLTYPVSTVWKVAKVMARTRYTLASDIRLYPSANIIPGFFKLIGSNASVVNRRRVFVLPVFEVHGHVQMPDNKRDLLRLVESGKVTYSKIYSCKKCREVLQLETWKKRVYSDDRLQVHTTVNRDSTLRDWEPIFISAGHDSVLKETADKQGGHGDKLMQLYRMCSLKYDFSVLNNAFLVHSATDKVQLNRTKHHLTNVYHNNTDC